MMMMMMVVDDDCGMTPAGGSKLLEDLAISRKTLLAPVRCAHQIIFIILTNLTMIMCNCGDQYGRPAKVVEDEEVPRGNEKAFEELEA